jgi:hypothetical protein
LDNLLIYDCGLSKILDNLLIYDFGLSKILDNLLIYDFGLSNIRNWINEALRDNALIFE